MKVVRQQRNLLRCVILLVSSCLCYTTAGVSGQTPYTNIGSAIADMSLPHEALVINPIYDWQKNPKITQSSPTGLDLPDWWTGNRPQWCYDVLTWYTLYEAQGNNATNTRVQIRNLRMYYLSNKSRTWRVTDTVDAPYTDIWQYPFDWFSGTTGVSRVESSGGISFKPTYPKFMHGYGGHTYTLEDPSDVRAVFVGIDFRLVVDDTTKADDRSRARYIVDTGADYYPGKGGSWGVDYAPGIGNGRYLLATNNWRTTTLLVPNDKMGATFEEMRKNPPPTINPDVTPSSSSTATIKSSSSSTGGASGTPQPTLYVSLTGCDTCGRDGKSLTNAFKSIAKAASVAVPGDIIQVQDGTYQVNSGTKSGIAITTSCSGSATKPITFQSQNKGGVKIVDSGLGIIWQHSGQFTIFSGFELTGLSRIGFYLPGSNNEVKFNLVHDLLCQGGKEWGGAAIDGIGNNMLVHHNVVRNLDVAQYTGTSAVKGISIAGAGWKVNNNIISGVPSGAINQWNGATSAIIMYNTVFNSGIGVLIGQGDSGSIMPPGTHDNLVQYNIFYNGRQGLFEYCYSGVKCTGVNNRYINNCFYLNTIDYNPNSLSTGVTYSGNLFSQPQFVNYKADGSGNYTQKSTSPCVKMGAGVIGVSSTAGTSIPSTAAMNISDESESESPFPSNATFDTDISDEQANAYAAETNNRPEDTTPAPVSAESIDSPSQSVSSAHRTSFTIVTLAITFIVAFLA